MWLQLEIAGKGVNLIADIRESANVQNCGHNVEEVDDGSVNKIKSY